jgi:hypothetical protein
MSFDDLVGAIRAEDGDDADLAAATQMRLRRSLEVRARGRHQLAGLLTAVAILFCGTVSWALATGRVSALWAPAPLLRSIRSEAVPRPPPPPPAPPRRARDRAGDLAIVTPPRPVPPPELETAPPSPEPPALPELPTAPVTPAPVKRRPRPVPSVPVAPVAVVEPVEALYRKAHELHFHGNNPAAALAAWDAYLAAEPAGRFSVEARYNRAILLIRLRRYAEARAALQPFARGEVEPARYRQAEAARLVERLAEYERR